MFLGTIIFAIGLTFIIIEEFTNRTVSITPSLLQLTDLLYDDAAQRNHRTCPSAWPVDDKRSSTESS